MNDYSLPFGQRRNYDTRGDDVLSSDLSDFSNFVEFANSYSSEKRLLAAQRCSNPLQKIENVAEMDEYLTILEKFLSGEDDDIRLAVLEQITGIFLELKKKSHVYFDCANRSLPRHIAHALALSIEAQVNAVDTITNLIESNSIAQDVLTEIFVPRLFSYIREASGENEVEISSLYRTNISNAVTVLCQIANMPDRYPPIWMFECFLRDFSALLIDRNSDVRKLSLSTIGSLAKYFGHAFTERCIIPHLANAIHDTSFWVRKVCCNVFVDVALSASMEIRQRTLTPLFLLLLNDADENIYNAAIRQIGPFIATFADPKRCHIDQNGLNSEGISDGTNYGENNIGLEKIKSFSSMDNLAALQSLDDNVRGKQYDEGIDESTFNDSNDESERDENAGVLVAYRFNNMPPGFIFPNDAINSTNNGYGTNFDMISNRQSINEYNSSDANKNNSRLPNVETPHMLINTICDDAKLSHEDDGKAPLNDLDNCTSSGANTVALTSSITFWSFGHISPISDADVDDYCSRSIIRRRECSSESIKIPYNKIEAENQSSVSPTIDNSANISMKQQATPLTNNSVTSEKAQEELSNVKSGITYESMTNEDWDAAFERANKALYPAPLPPPSPPSSSSSSGSNYWQRRLDLLHKSVQSVVHNSSNALAAAALLPSSLKRLSLDSLNSNSASTNDDVESKTVNAKRKLEKLASKTISNELWTVTEHETSRTVPSKEPATNTRSLSRFTTSAVTDSRNFTVAEKLKFRILEAEDELTPDERMNYNSRVNSAHPTTSTQSMQSRVQFMPQQHHGQFFTEEELKLLYDSTQDIVPQELLERLNQELLSRPHFEMNWHIAHSMPAIVYTLGRKNWIHIKGLYLYLTDHYHMEVRKSLANSLHEVAAIIGTNNADRDLLPVFLKFLEDTAEVRYGLLRNLYHFCKVLSFSCRRQLAQKLNLFVTVDSNNSSYRIRAEFAEQLVLLVRLFSAQEVNKFVCAYALTFATDRIAEVRSNGIKILAEVLALFIREEWANFVDKFLEDETLAGGGNGELNGSENGANGQPNASISLPLTDSLLHDVRIGFWRTRNWRRRQSFGRMLDFILRNELITEDQFFYIFYDDFMHVSEDEVANVRQYFCSMCQLTRASGFFKADRSVSISVRSRLKGMIEEDPDLEIRHQAQIALGELNPETAEIDLGQRGIQLHEATESIYNRCRPQHRLSSSDKQPEYKFEQEQKSQRQVCTITPKYTSYSPSSSVINSSAIASDSSFNYPMPDNNDSDNSIRKTCQFQYFPNQFTPRVPPLALADDEDDDTDYRESSACGTTSAFKEVTPVTNKRCNDDEDVAVREVVEALLCNVMDTQISALL